MVWQLLEKDEPYSRDYLLPTASNNYKGSRTRSSSIKLLSRSNLEFWLSPLTEVRGSFGRILGTITRPTAGGTSCPRQRLSSVNFSRSDRDMLRGWSAEGSDRNSRAAKLKNTSMQQAVSLPFKNPDHDPLAEADDIDLLGQFLRSWDVLDEEVLRTKTLLVSRTFTDVQREDSSEVRAGDVDLFPGEPLADDILDETAAMNKESREG